MTQNLDNPPPLPPPRTATKCTHADPQELMKCKDARIRLTEETVAAMKIIKLYAWEEPFEVPRRLRAKMRRACVCSCVRACANEPVFHR